MSDACAPDAFDALPEALLHGTLLPLLPRLEDRLRLSATSRRWRALLRTPAFYRALAQHVRLRARLGAKAATKAANHLAEVCGRCDASARDVAADVAALVAGLPPARHKRRVDAQKDRNGYPLGRKAAAAAAAAAQKSSARDALAAALQDAEVAADAAHVATEALRRAALDSFGVWRTIWEVIEHDDDDAMRVHIDLRRFKSPAATEYPAACVARAEAVAAATEAVVAPLELAAMHAGLSDLVRVPANDIMGVLRDAAHAQSTGTLLPILARFVVEYAAMTTAAAVNAPAAAARAAAATAAEDEDGSANSGGADAVTAQLARAHA
jgi:hypothetical protein